MYYKLKVNVLKLFVIPAKAGIHFICCAIFHEILLNGFPYARE